MVCPQLLPLLRGRLLDRKQTRAAMGRRYHYYVYVIELSKDVLYEPRFRKANPDYVDGKQCVYVGMTGLNPDLRFDKHKAGIQAESIRAKIRAAFADRPLRSLTIRCPTTARVTWKSNWRSVLREAGYGVWQA